MSRVEPLFIERSHVIPVKDSGISLKLMLLLQGQNTKLFSVLFDVSGSQINDVPRYPGVLGDIITAAKMMGTQEINLIVFDHIIYHSITLKCDDEIDDLNLSRIFQVGGFGSGGMGKVMTLLEIGHVPFEEDIEVIENVHSEREHKAAIRFGSYANTPIVLVSDTFTDEIQVVDSLIEVRAPDYRTPVVLIECKN